MIYNSDGLEMLKKGGWDHIITDPDYKNQPPIDEYRKYCDGNLVIFCDPRKRPVGPDPDQVLFWNRTLSTKWSTKRCNNFVEEILIYEGKTHLFNTIHWTSMTGIFSDSFIEKPDHPYTKPITMMEKLVLMYSNPGDLIFDPFSGSGTTGLAAIRNGRRFVGCELNPEYYSLAISRGLHAT